MKIKNLIVTRNCFLILIVALVVPVTFIEGDNSVISFMRVLLFYLSFFSPFILAILGGLIENYSFKNFLLENDNSSLYFTPVFIALNAVVLALLMKSQFPNQYKDLGEYLLVAASISLSVFIGLSWILFFLSKMIKKFVAKFSFTLFKI